MKKVVIILLVIISLFNIVGCSNGKTSANPSTVIPNPKDTFVNENISIISDDHEQYYIRVNDFALDEYDTYVELCKNSGFGDVQFEKKNDDSRIFLANSDDGKYYLEITYGVEFGYLNITCSLNDEE